MLLQLHIEDIKLSYQSLVGSTVMQRMNGISPKKCPGHFTSRKIDFSFIFLESGQAYCIGHHAIAFTVLIMFFTDVRLICIWTTIICIL